MVRLKFAMDLTVTWGRGIAPVGSLGLPIEERALPTQLAAKTPRNEANGPRNGM